MSSEYTFDIAGSTLNGLVAANRLTLELGQSSITQPVESVSTFGDTVYIVFADDLTEAELTTLGSVLGAHKGNPLRDWTVLVYQPELEPVIPGASKVVANGRPAIEIQNGVTGYAAVQAVWPFAQDDDAQIRVRAYFILKATGTGSNVRIAARVKAEGPGEDSTVSFSGETFVVAPVTFTTIGEVFAVEVVLDASVADHDDAIALQVGRDGANSLGAGASDDIDQAIQIIALKVEAR